MEISPKNIDALLNLGSALHTSKKYKESILCYDKALKIDKKCAMAFAYKGLAFAELGEISSALTFFKKALVIDKDYDLAKISKDEALKILKLKLKNEFNRSKIQ